jgi:hypothetical protein
MSCIINGSAGLTTNSGAVYNGIQGGTAVASTSGTSIDFTSIPSWVKRITIMLTGVSTNGTSSYIVQLGAGSVTTSGYSSTGAYSGSGTNSANSTAGMIIYNNTATATISGQMVITNVSGNTWVSSHTMRWLDSFALNGGGTVALSGTLDRVRITTVNGTDTFDAGSINILYE